MSISNKSFRISQGNLRHRVEIQRATETLSSMGSVIQTFEYVCDRFAMVEDLVGRELEIARQVNSQMSHKVTIRFFDQLRSRDRFIYKDRIFNIEYMQDILQEGKKQICFCTETITDTGDPLD